MSGLFSTFNVAKSGMTVQQKAIDVTSHNIANANTEGYSRQRAKIETTRPFGMPSLTSVSEPGQLGTGAQIAAIERVRDSFLDYQVRTETSTLGQYSARSTYLSQVESILNEPSDTGLSTLIGKFYDGWQQLSKQPQSSNARTVVAQQSLALTDELNHTYTQLEKLKENAQSSLNQNTIDVNSMLDQIDDLNQQIVQVKVAGNMPNDLMDKRDLLVDQLSEKFGVTIEKQNLEGIDLKTTDNSSDDNYDLVNAIIDGSEKRFSYIKKIEESSDNGDGTKNYNISYYKLGNTASASEEVTLTVQNVDEDEFRTLDQCRVVWANNEGVAIDASGNDITAASIDFDDLNLYEPEDGELKGYMSIQKDIDEYKDELNRLAKAIAYTVNAVHSGTSDASTDSLPFFVNGDSASPTTATDESSITAENITINQDIIDDVMLINVGETATSGETDGNRALAIATLRDALVKIQDITSTSTRDDLINFTATANNMEIEYDVNGTKADDYFKDTVNRLGIQAQEADRMVTNQESLLDSFEESRLSVSGVSLDEEMANLVQFQHAYNANAKMISTVDELLEVVINGLKK